MPDVNAFKFGEACQMGTPSQAWEQEGVETRWRLPRTGKGIVQTTNSFVGVVKTIVVRKSPAFLGMRVRSPLPALTERSPSLVYGIGLENRRGSHHREFESPPLRFLVCVPL